ncbi:hypothetical protein J1614_008181 [Plenodomus biglobosus]|nr:hypothetical protein J1614_008181 [Plenodomus biglobosus]
MSNRHLEKRIRETEALLALQLTGTNLDLSNDNFMPLPSTSPSFTTPTSPDSTVSLSPTATGQLLTDDDHVPVTGDYKLAWLANTNFGDIQSLVPTTVDMEMAVAMNLEPIHSDHPRRQNWPRSSKDWFTTGTPESTQSFTPAHSISAKDLQDLQYIFLNHIHPVMPIINPTCFYQALQNAPDIQASLPIIDQVQSITRPELLTPFSGLVLTVFALRKVFEHTLQTATAERIEPQWGLPGFWDRHYSLLKLIRVLETLIEPMTLPQALYSDPVAFNIYLVFHVVKIDYEGAIQEGERRDLPLATVAAIEDELIANALKIAAACDSSSLSGAFVGWSLHIAVKALSRSTLPDHKQSRAPTIQMLHASLDDVELSDGTWHKGLSQVCPHPRP